MPGWLYEAGPNGLGIFLLLTVAIGGLTAYVTGRAIAQSWRPTWQIPVYVVLLTFAVRFLHFALFEETLLSARNFGLDLVLLQVAAALGYRIARASQMSTQYSWLFHGSGTLGWHPRKPD